MSPCRKWKVLSGDRRPGPLRRARLARHIRDCALCRAEAAGREEARAVLIPESRTAPSPRLWVEVERRLDSRPKLRTRSPKAGWRWAFSGACLAGLLAVVLVSRIPRRPQPIPSAGDVKLRLLDVRIDQQPAQTFIYETRDSDRTFVWVEKQ